MKKYLLVIVPLVAILAGCLGDTIDGPQRVAQSIFPPGAIYYQAITGTKNLEIRWNPPIVDTQANFKGYIISLHASQPSFFPVDTGIIYPPIDSIHVSKTDTMYTFINKVVQGGRYTVFIWGEQNTDPSKDTIIKSLGHTDRSFTFDSRPVLAPSAIFASSNGPGGVNLFWPKAGQDSNAGMAGYIIRYIDPANRGSRLTFLAKTSFDSANVVGANWRAQVSLPPNPSSPVEKPYQFYIKAVRKDSVESADSIGIIWSGAEIMPPAAVPVKLDTGLFFGAVGTGYNMVEVPAADPVNAYLQITSSGGNIVLIGKNATQFASRIDTGSGLTFSTNFFANPFSNSDFNQSQVSFPSVVQSNQSTMVYALFPGGSRARILLTSTQDTVGHVSKYIRSDNTVLVQSSFQPIETIQLPFF